MTGRMDLMTRRWQLTWARELQGHRMLPIGYKLDLLATKPAALTTYLRP